MSRSIWIDRKLSAMVHQVYECLASIYTLSLESTDHRFLSDCFKFKQLLMCSVFDVLVPVTVYWGGIESHCSRSYRETYWCKGTTIWSGMCLLYLLHGSHCLISVFKLLPLVQFKPQNCFQFHFENPNNTCRKVLHKSDLYNPAK